MAATEGVRRDARRIEATAVAVEEAIEATARRLQADQPAALDAAQVAHELTDELARQNGGPWSSIATNPTPPLEAWPKAGTVALALDDESGRAFAIADICCGYDDLSACARTAALLAIAVAEGEAAVAFLIGAAPAADWNRRNNGMRMFESRAWSADLLLDHGGDALGENGPTQLPADWRVTELGEAAFDLNGERWELHVSQVGNPSQQTLGVAAINAQRAQAARNQAVEPAWFELRGGSGPGLQFTAGWDGEQIALDRRLWMLEGRTWNQRQSKHALQPGEQDWRTFWRRIEELEVWEWDADYQPPVSINDGYGWRVELSAGGRIAKSEGYMAFPSSSRSGPRATWDGFLLAVDVLAGGVRLS